MPSSISVEQRSFNADILPKFLYGSYKRYKADTTTFVDWVVETARKCGHQATLDESSTVAGKKTAKQKSKTSAQPSKYKITLKELSRLAHAIAESNTNVPTVILATLKRAIALRKRCGDWFLAKGKRNDAANETHSHFIDALQELCDILEWKSPKRSAATSSEATPNKTDIDDQELLGSSSNSFAALSLEEIEDTGVEYGAEPAAPEQRMVEIDEETGDENPYSLLFFHMYCLFEDLQNMREFVSQTLKEYVNGEIDLMNLAVVTDTAVNLSRQLTDDVLSAWRGRTYLRCKMSSSFSNSCT